MPFLTNDPLPQCLQPSPLTPLLLDQGHQRGSRRHLSNVKCLHIGTQRTLSYAEVRARISNPLKPIDAEKLRELNTQTTSLVIGKLYLYVHSTSVPGLGSVLFEDEIKAMLRPIWPLTGQTIDWPPAIGINDANVTALRS